jgi:hypothetical protein
VGFGDIIAGEAQTFVLRISRMDATHWVFIWFLLAQQTNGKLLWLYRISWIIWVTLGIAYWAIVINFITKALKVIRLLKKTIANTFRLMKFYLLISPKN